MKNSELSLPEQLQLLQPSKCDKQMSRHYKTYDTVKMAEMLLALTSKGEQVFELRQIQWKKTSKKTMAQGRSGRGIHTVRIKTRKAFEINGEMQFPEVVIINSYDGSSPLKIMCGIFRLVCSNGLVIKTKDFGEMKQRHMRTEEEIVMEIAAGFAKTATQAINLQTRLAETNLNSVQIKEFAKQAAKLRWKGIAEDAEYEDLVKVERVEDEGDDIWKVFNRVQEKMINGGIKLEGMKRTAKPIENAAKDIWLNEELFSLALSFLPVDETLDVEVNELVTV
jgi:hypothetical protein